MDQERVNHQLTTINLFTKWAATVLPRALRFKRPLHRCNACSPKAPLDGEDSVLSGAAKWSQPTVTLRPGLAYDAWRLT